MRSFGAVGDGQVRPLSSRFKTLAEARTVYPFAERLDQSLDWAGIQAALDRTEPIGGTVVIPTGRFLISDTLRVPSGVTLQGESRSGSIIDNQNWRLNAPQLTNKDPLAFLYVTIRDLTLNGGTHALKVQASREVAGIVLDGLTTNLQTEANLDFSSLQTCVIRDCHLMDGDFGLTVRGFPCNSVHLVNTRIGQHSDASIRLRGVDGFVMFGGSIEAGITPGKATIDVETGGAYAQAIEFDNVYFENTHTTLLRSRGATGVTFANCKFTGTGVGEEGGVGPYQFDCGDDLISFSNNFFHVLMTGPANMLMMGNNHGLRAGGSVWRQRDASRAVLLSRNFSIAEAKNGLLAVVLNEDAGRVCGTMEIFIDSASSRPLRRIEIPLDLVVEVDNGRPSLTFSNTGPLGIHAEQDRIRLWLNEVPAIDGTKGLRFTLDLWPAGSGGMDVKVL